MTGKPHTRSLDVWGPASGFLGLGTQICSSFTCLSHSSLPHVLTRCPWPGPMTLSHFLQIRSISGLSSNAAAQGLESKLEGGGRAADVPDSRYASTSSRHICLYQLPPPQGPLTPTPQSLGNPIPASVITGWTTQGSGVGQ